MNLKEVKEIIDKQELSDVEVISVIEQYIFDLKGVVVKINRPVGNPCLSLFYSEGLVNDFTLMWRMYLKCIEYYGGKD